MLEKMSRMDKHEAMVVSAAEKGKWDTTLILYKSEICRLEKKWKITIEPLTLSGSDMILCKLRWDNAFEQKELNKEQSNYILAGGSMPGTESFAQQLFLITAKVH